MTNEKKAQTGKIVTACASVTVQVILSGISCDDPKSALRLLQEKVDSCLARIDDKYILSSYLDSFTCND